MLDDGQLMEETISQRNDKDKKNDKRDGKFLGTIATDGFVYDSTNLKHLAVTVVFLYRCWCSIYTLSRQSLEIKQILSTLSEFGNCNLSRRGLRVGDRLHCLIKLNFHFHSNFRLKDGGIRWRGTKR